MLTAATDGEVAYHGLRVGLECGVIGLEVDPVGLLLAKASIDSELQRMVAPAQ